MKSPEGAGVNPAAWNPGWAPPAPELPAATARIPFCARGGVRSRQPFLSPSAPSMWADVPPAAEVSYLEP